MKNLRTTLTTILTALIATTIQAATVYTSPASGSANWGSISWSQSGTGTPVTHVIQAGFTATINANTTLFDTLKIFGVLDFRSNLTLTMNTNGYIDLKSGGTVTGGSGNTTITFGGNGSFTGPWNGSGTSAGPSYATQSTSGFVSGTALPVTWNYFKATTENNAILLEWSTATEINNSHFDIERASADGNFEKIGEVMGNGNSHEKLYYNFTDKNPLTGKSFYRLKQTDFDGAFEYSEVVAINTENANPVKVFPTIISTSNPVLQVSNLSEQTNIRIIDTYGKVLNYQNQITDNSFTMQIEDLSKKGTLFVEIFQNNEIKTFKILVQ